MQGWTPGAPDIHDWRCRTALDDCCINQANDVLWSQENRLYLTASLHCTLPCVQMLSMQQSMGMGPALYGLEPREELWLEATTHLGLMGEGCKHYKQMQILRRFALAAFGHCKILAVACLDVLVPCRYGADKASMGAFLFTWPTGGDVGCHWQVVVMWKLSHGCSA
jgi:hypothetical protein